MKKNSKLMPVVFALIPVAVGGLSALLAGGNLSSDYKTPPLNPPDWVFLNCVEHFIYHDRYSKLHHI